jgi:putative DeoR family transcriptional regulator (stage III sporulation protein D)
MLNKFGKDRAELIAAYVIETGATVRAAAIHFCISKSTVHKDLTYKLRYTNPTLYENARAVLDQNKMERHIRGGEATRQKYMQRRLAKKM